MEIDNRDAPLLKIHMDNVPFHLELQAAWNHFKVEWKIYAAPFLILTLILKVIAMIPGLGLMVVLFVGWPLSWIFYVALYRHYQSERRGEPAENHTLGTLLDQMGNEWPIILAASMARYTRIFSAGSWMIYPAFLKAGQLVLVPQALAYDRTHMRNANEVSEAFLAENDEGWKVVQISAGFFLAAAMGHILLNWILPGPLAFLITLFFNAALSFYLLIFYYEIWTARAERIDKVPITANHAHDVKEYGSEIKAEMPKAFGMFLVLFFAIALIGFSGIETLIHFVH